MRDAARLNALPRISAPEREIEGGRDRGREGGREGGKEGGRGWGGERDNSGERDRDSENGVPKLGCLTQPGLMHFRVECEVLGVE